jgi:anti-sigma28 factor (negative regulator of flagellin synthesis)
MCFDKTRIVCQHYQLYKKAYEIIKRKSQDTRIEQAEYLKRRINQGLYKINPEKLAQNLIKIF